MSTPLDSDDPFLPRRNPHLEGHAAAEARLLDSWNSGRMHHAWLIGGPPGIGKATLAFRMARFVLAKGGEAGGDALFAPPPSPTSLVVDPANPVFKRVAAAGHADLLTIQRTWDEKRKRFKRDLPVEEVRRIAPFLRLTSAEGGWRVVVVDGADQLNVSGQNAILKILEEPPPRTLILLVADNVGALLPTIRSRSRRLMLEPLPEATVRTLLFRYRPDLEEAERTALARLAEGSVGRALELQSAGGLDLYKAMLGLFETLPRLDLLTAYQFVDGVLRGQDDAAWTAVTELVGWWLGRMARARARGALPPEVVPGEAALMQRLLQGSQRAGGLDRWVEVWENTNHLFTKADSANLDRRQILMNALLRIEDAAA
ncbi:DNA polymerase III subunit delta' [Oleisolibacter albus]|uniref:DNA polymerase III subunit delta' n=1 Tax=Oleisolibacter albus TaxID=2171757 RepID=UPI000DF3C9BD|nr:DNA polymerase III subunit delta' [Oleisolibacter albus]